MTERFPVSGFHSLNQNPLFLLTIKTIKMKVAKLVYLSMMTRVVVDENATEEEIVEQSKVNFIEKVHNEIHENVEEVIDDDVVPYDEEFDK